MEPLSLDPKALLSYVLIGNIISRGVVLAKPGNAVIVPRDQLSCYMPLFLLIPLVWSILFKGSSMILLQIRILESIEEMQRTHMLISQVLRSQLFFHR